jgi:hypothetical protein
MTIDTSKLKLSTKSLVAAFFAFGGLMQIDSVKQLVLSATAAHPRIAGLVTFAVGAYSVLHSPEVQQALGIKQTVAVTTEEVTLKTDEAK